MSGDYVSAVPGSGKTETLINKCYELMEEEGVENVVAITFTDRASEELVERLKKRALKEGKSELVRQLPTSNVGTIHNFCSKIVRKYGSEIGIPWNFRVMDELESFNMLERSVRNFIINTRNANKVTEKGLLLGRMLEEFGTDVEQVIKDCTEVMEAQKGYLDYMMLTNRSFYTMYRLESFDEAVMKEVSSRLRISLIPSLLSLLSSFVSEYQAIKRKARLMDFDDLLLYTLKVMDVRGEEVAKKYKYILVDEFQDTDELQIALFNKFLENDSTFFVVGDLNQSIYSFRGAHPGAQRNFSDRISNQITLKTNRRSGKNLITFFNKFFPTLIEYEPMEGSSDHLGGAYLHIEDDKLLAVAEIIKMKIREGKLPGKIAVLSRTSSDFFNLKRYLKREGIDCVLISGESILKSQEGLDVLSLVRYLADPGDQVAQASLLFSPMFSMNVSDLMRSKDKLGEVLETKLGKYRQEVRDERIDFLINRIMLKEEYTSNLLGTIDGRERVDRLYRILELISSHVSAYGGNVYSLVEWLQNASNSKESGPIEDLLEDQSRVKIMTIHQAKGLEFDSVIIYDLRPGVDREKYYADEYVGIVAKREKDFITSPSKKIIGKSERHSFSLNEESRILYVAFTRAKSDLHFVFSEKDLKDERNAKKADDLISLFQRTIGLWKESDPKGREEAISKMSLISSKISKTSPLEQKKIDQSVSELPKLNDIRPYTQNDDDNEQAIVQFLKGKGDKIKEFRLYSNGSRVTITEMGLKIYEDISTPNNYFVKNGEIKFIL
ncbi:MAG: ATP-dependent helicase [Candidatus Thermoplasmatota archaeon]|jgi:superfamily I DNA/RNA helicase|nr:ATP-dependent helicase [Candidatus Thermoplasmatota archaeon]